MTITERKKALLEQLRNERERKQQLTDALEQARNNEQQLIGAITVLDQLEKETAAPTPTPVAEPAEAPVAKKNDGE